MSRCIFSRHSGSCASNALVMEKIAPPPLPLPFLRRRGVSWACLAIFFLALGLGEVCSGDAWNQPSEGTGVGGSGWSVQLKGLTHWRRSILQLVARSKRVWTHHPYACSLRRLVPPRANLTQPQGEEKDCEARPAHPSPTEERGGGAIFSITRALDAQDPE